MLNEAKKLSLRSALSFCSRGLMTALWVSLLLILFNTLFNPSAQKIRALSDMPHNPATLLRAS